MIYTIQPTHADDIVAGDTIEIDGVATTVCPKDIKYGGFMGTSIFGNSYDSGYRPVKKCNIVHVKPNINHQS